MNSTSGYYFDSNSFSIFVEIQSCQNHDNLRSEIFGFCTYLFCVNTNTEKKKINQSGYIFERYDVTIIYSFVCYKFIIDVSTVFTTGIY